jgi:hypothetical protein
VAYEIEFTADLPVRGSQQYINKCCWGGDVIRDRLIGPITDHVATQAASGTEYLGVRSGQEDWGWFIWARCNSVVLATDIYCDDNKTGAYRLHLYGRKKKSFFRWQSVDVPQLSPLKDVVVEALQRWAKLIGVVRYTPDFMTKLPD